MSHLPEPVSRPINRRTMLVRSAQVGGLAIGGAAVLAACSSDSETPTPASSAAPGSSSAGSETTKPDLGALDFRLSWVKNVEFAGEYIADTEGYYLDQGFSSVNLIGGGPSATPVETDLVQDKCFIGLSSPDITASAIVEGAPLKIIGAQFQKNPFCVMYMADNPIATAEDMVGKKIGVQAANDAVWAAFLKANNIDPDSIDKVPVQFDPLPLTTGEVDGWFSFVTNEPNTLKVKGFDVGYFLLADYNYPLVAETYTVRQESIDGERDKLKAVLIADIMGWKENLADPAKGAKLAVEVYGKDLGLTLEEQTLESKAENELILTADTKKNGIFTMTDELIAENISTLAIAGITVTAEQLFDFSIIEEIYAENPDLI